MTESLAQPATAASATQQMQAVAQDQPAEGCPLCGAPLAADQEWCLQCGAAARTRLAATPNWKAPAATIAVIVALALGVLAAALVKLAHDSGPAPAPTTTTVTTPAGAATTTPTTAQPGATLTQPTTPTTTPTTPSTTPSTATTIPTTPTTPTRTNGGAVAPGLAGGTPAR